MKNSHLINSGMIAHSHNLNNEEIINLNSALDAFAIVDFEEKWTIAKVLVKYGDIVISPLKTVILNKTASLDHRCFSLRVLSQLKNPEIVLIATQLLMNTEQEELIALATQTLAVQGKDSIAFLSELLEDEDYRLLACKALGQIPNRLVIEPLISVVEDHNREVKKTAICALRNFNDSRIIKIMTNALQDYHSEIRKEALIALGLKLKANPQLDVIEIVIPLLNDLNLSVAQQAAMTLSRCHHPLAISALENILNSKITPKPLTKTVIKVLGWIATSESIQCLGKFMTTNESSLTIEIIKILGRVNKPELKSEVTTILDRFYHSKSPHLTDAKILQTLCYSWTQLQAVKVIPMLKQIPMSENQQVSLHARAAIETLSHS